MRRIKQVLKKMKEKVQNVLRSITKLFTRKEQAQAVQEEPVIVQDTQYTYQKHNRYHREGQIIYLHYMYQPMPSTNRYGEVYQKVYKGVNRELYEEVQEGVHKESYRGGRVRAIRSRAPTRTG